MPTLDRNLDPPPTRTWFRDNWDNTPARPLTQPPIGTSTHARRSRDATLSALWLDSSMVSRAMFGRSHNDEPPDLEPRLVAVGGRIAPELPIEASSHTI